MVDCANRFIKERGGRQFGIEKLNEELMLIRCDYSRLGSSSLTGSNLASPPEIFSSWASLSINITELSEFEVSGYREVTLSLSRIEYNCGGQRCNSEETGPILLRRRV